ncbi:deoxyribonuclease IV [Patescibacteria group bacterium]
MKIGGHVSIAGGFDKSIDRAVNIGANCLQTFASSPRSLKTKDFEASVIDKYLQKKSENKMGSHFFHGVYLINLAHESQEYVEASIESLLFYQKFSKKINGEGTIFHIGSHKGRGFDAVKKQIAGAVEKVLSKTPDDVMLFLENAAGQKGIIGSNLEDLRYIYDSISSDELKRKLGVCYDTQHGFASGLDVRSEKSLENTVDKIKNTLGVDLIKVVHINDSKVELSSNRDRHENVGEGMIGEDGFRLFTNHPTFSSLPFLLEVPGENKSGPRKIDIENFQKIVD